MEDLSAVVHHAQHCFTHTNRIIMFLRFIITLLWLPPSLIILIILSPLRLTLEPLLRHQLLVSSRFQPLDFAQWLWTYLQLKILDIRVRVVGAENVDQSKPHMYFFKHSSNIDPFIIMHSLPQSIRFVGKRAIFYVPLFGQAAYLYGHVPINREVRDEAVKALQSSISRIKEEHKCLAISPEGTRSISGRTNPFKKGPFHLSEQHRGIDIIPCACVGAHELMPPKSWWPRSGEVVLVIGKTIKNDGSSTRDEIAEKVRQFYVHIDSLMYSKSSAL